MSSILQKKPITAWFASNSVVANVLMLSLLSLGIYRAFTVQKEGFPAFDAESISITASIQGGTPENVERGVAIKIEEALESVTGIDHIQSTSTDNQANITVEAKEGYSLAKLLDDVKIKIDSLSSLPDELDNITITEARRQSTVMWVEISGNSSEKLRKETARDVRDALLAHEDINLVSTFGARDYEISIEPSEEKLRQYNLTFEELSTAIANQSVELSGGELRSSRGDISLRIKGQAYVRDDFANLTLRSNADGTRLLVKDVADVRDGFVDQKFLNRFNGNPTVSLKVATEGEDDLIKAVEATREVINNYKELPESLQIEAWLDGSTNIRNRLSLLSKNGIQAILLVMVCLMFFLNLRLAFWVAVGIPVSLAGALSLFPLPGIDLTVNLISAFGFLVVLGIVVDDAIVIGESIFTAKEKASSEASPLEATVKGVSKVIAPATFGVLTTIAAFIPLTQVSGRMGNVFGQMATVVILCLIFSLIESKFILPAHLAHMNVNQKPKFAITKFWAKIQSKTNNSLKTFVKKCYLPTSRFCVKWRYAVAAAFIGLFFVVIGLFKAGTIRSVFFPSIIRDEISVNLELEQGLSVDYLHENALKISETLIAIGAKYENKFGKNPITNVQISASSNNVVSIVAEMTSSSTRSNIPNEMILTDVRKSIGGVSGARSLTFSARAGSRGGDISIKLESENLQQLKEAADVLKNRLATISTLSDINDSFDDGKPEIIYSITPQGEASGFTSRDLGVNVRNAFFGNEVQRIQRDRDEVRVMVRYPQKQRSSLETLENMRVRKTDGSTIPFGQIAETTYAESLASIKRYDGKRVVTVEASVDKTVTSSRDIIQSLNKEFFPSFLNQYPDTTLSLGGEAEQRGKSIGSLRTGLGIALIAIYILIAIPLKSYGKPLLIMSVIPFGIIGALLGHLIVGIPVSILSMFGILALAGVVVNDSLVLVCHIGDLRADKLKFKEACEQAGADRFRAILLTSLTTFVGLAPILLEKDLQAQFLKPMACSLAFGILFATFITLILLPSLMMIAKDFQNLFKRLYNIKIKD